jgi:cytochrome P450
MTSNLRLKENTALRLFPPVPINTRFCKQATTLPKGGGPDGLSPLLVREGMPVAYSVYHMQRREDFYGSDALIFRPERWEDPALADLKWGYLPFNGGPRLCLGSEPHNRTLLAGQKLTSGCQRTLGLCLLHMGSQE